MTDSGQTSERDDRRPHTIDKPIAASTQAEANNFNIAILEGLRVCRQVKKQKQVLDHNGELVGQLTDGDPDKCRGCHINAMGEVLSHHNARIGSVAVVEGKAAHKLAKITAEFQATEGLIVDADAQVRKDGHALAKLQGEVKLCVGKKVGKRGIIFDDSGHYLGKIILNSPTSQPAPRIKMDGFSIASLEDHDDADVGKSLPPKSFSLLTR